MTDFPKTIRDLVLGYRRRDFSPVEVAHNLARRVQEGRELNCLRWYDEERLLAEAGKAADVIFSQRGNGILTGVPLVLKDNIDTAGIPTTSGSATRLGNIPARDATVWARLKNKAGAVLLGKANLSEFAYAGPHPHFGPVLNPRNPAHTPGSSSSGSAAAVAAGMAPGSLGTDTGGSVRVPAAFCGLVGLKPTNDLVDITGVTPLAWSLDTVGVLASTVTDVAILFECMLREPLGIIDADSLTVSCPRPESLCIGVDQGFFLDQVQPEIVDSLKAAIQRLKAAGSRVKEISIPDVENSHVAHRIILLSEAFAYHADGLDRGDPFGPDFRGAVEVGRHITAQSYINALRWRRLMMDQLQSVFEQVDFVLAPTCRTTAPSMADLTRTKASSTQFTFLANFGGLPSISLPDGLDGKGLPLGLQLIGRPNSDKELLGVALLLEEQILESIERRSN